jgi:hypothetical protein
MKVINTNSDFKCMLMKSEIVSMHGHAVNTNKVNLLRYNIRN